MATTLTKIARTILRSRLRRHKDQLVIRQHIEGSYGAGMNISNMANAALIETATRFGLGVPSEAECDAYVRAKVNGSGSAAALNAADTVALASGVSLAALVAAGTTPPHGESDTPDDEPDDEPIDAAPEEAAPEEAAPEEAAPADPVKEAAKRDVEEALALMGLGDFVGFRARLDDMALRANRPDLEPRVIEAAPPAPAGSANRIGVKTMTEVGLPRPLYGMVAKTALAVYDAADAPAVDPAYVWPDATCAILAQLARGRHPFLVGPAGTGKTSLAQQIAARWGRPFVRISCDDQTEAAMLVGMTVPDKAGGVTWQDGQLTAAIRRPGTVILIDEPSVARPGALFVLQAVLDADRRIHIAETGEVVRVAPDVLFLLADNTNGTGDITGAYEATRRLNRAFLDRAGITVRMDYLPCGKEAKALTARTGCDGKLASALCRFAALTRQKADRGEVSHPIGFRRLVALAELISDGVDSALAYQMAVIETAPFDDQEPLRQMFMADFKVPESK